MLDGRGQVRITDFGLAKLADEGVQAEVAGTPMYMAPEQLLRGEASIESDLYALGLILLAVILAHDPFLLRTHINPGIDSPAPWSLSALAPGLAAQLTVGD